MPVVVVVGRPNVGKSTLFNRLAGEPLAIVDDVPGTTRDRLLSRAEWNGRSFYIIDTGGIDPSEGEKTPLSIGSADFIEHIRAQAMTAISDADVVLFITDASSGVTPADEEIALILRKHQKKRDGVAFPPVLLVVNKADNQTLRAMAVDFYSLGLGDPHPISALHGTETGDMLDELVSMLPPAEPEVEDDSIQIAIVGKPNVGKSSLLNRLVGEERSIVSEIPGTTRDAVDINLEYAGFKLNLIDTAGMRRRGKIEPGVEKFSIIRTLRAIDRCEVALLVIDAIADISAQDAHIAGYILEAWKSAVIVVNKWDAITKDSFTMDEYSQRIRQALNFLDYVPVIYISAKTGQRVDKVLPTALQVEEQRITRISTARLNRILEKAQELHAPASHSGRQLKIYYGSQTRVDPPTFVLHVNDPKLMHFTYQRFIENQLRAEFPFTGTPVKFILAAHRKAPAKKK